MAVERYNVEYVFRHNKASVWIRGGSIKLNQLVVVSSCDVYMHRISTLVFHQL